MNLGWRDDLEDRSFLERGESRLLSTIPMRFSAPEEFDPTTWLRTEDQGQMGSCTGWGRTTCREVLYYIKSGGKIVQFSALFAYLTGQKSDGLLGKDQGATISGSIQAAKEYGDCFESVMPYPSPVRYPSPATIPKHALDAAIEFNDIEYVKCGNYSDVIRSLKAGFTISLGIKWVEGIATNRSGVIEVSDLRGDVFGGHCVAAVGWSKETDSDGRNYVKVKNSHGAQYGKNGTVNVAPACFDHWGRDGYAEMIAIADRKTYDPDVWSWLGKGLLA